MKTDQKYSPKYWVVHDKTTEDVLLHTARKSSEDSIKALVDSKYKGVDIDIVTALDQIYDENSNLECILIEIKEVCND